MRPWLRLGEDWWAIGRGEGFLGPARPSRGAARAAMQQRPGGEAVAAARRDPRCQRGGGVGWIGRSETQCFWIGPSRSDIDRGIDPRCTGRSIAPRMQNRYLRPDTGEDSIRSKFSESENFDRFTAPEGGKSRVSCDFPPSKILGYAILLCMAYKVSTNWLLAVSAKLNLKEIGYLLAKIFNVENGLQRMTFGDHF